MENLFKLNSTENNADFEDKYVNKYVKIIIEPYHHIKDIKGENYRLFIYNMYNYWLKLDKVEMKLIDDTYRILHSAYILVDDILDSSELRRGIPAAHIIYGVGPLITSIDFIWYTFVLNKMNNDKDSYMLCKLVVDLSLEILRGIATETYWRDNSICPSEEEYFAMVYRKTGYFFLLLSDSMELYSKFKVNLKKFSLIFGMYCQVLDDYSAMNSKMVTDSKGFCDDIREGKFGFPIMHAINSRPNDKRVYDIVKMHTDDINLKMQCLELLEEFGSMEYTRNTLRYYEKLLLQEVDKFEFNENFVKLFKLHNYDE